MRIALIAGLVIVLPAIVVVLSYWGSPVMIPALASVSVAFIPFVIFGFFIRAAREEDEEH